jgi:hypothetical protein
MTDADLKLNDALDDVVARLVAIAGLGGVALVHVLQLPEASTHPWARQTSRSLKPRT